MHRVCWPDPDGSRALVERAAALLDQPRSDGVPRDGAVRRVLGITGAPAGGKSTLADWLVATLLEQHPGQVAQVGMDAFHIGHRVLVGHDLVGVKGAPHTFDGAGYAALLERIRTTPETVYAPAFHREIEDSIAHEVEIGPVVRLVVTEGNYLLRSDPPWDRVRPLLDDAWFVHLDDDERRRRLLARHLRYGHDPAEAELRTYGSDEANAQQVNATGSSADLWIDVTYEDA